MVHIFRNAVVNNLIVFSLIVPEHKWKLILTRHHCHCLFICCLSIFHFNLITLFVGNIIYLLQIKIIDFLSLNPEFPNNKRRSGLENPTAIKINWAKQICLFDYFDAVSIALTLMMIRSRPLLDQCIVGSLLFIAIQSTVHFMDYVSSKCIFWWLAVLVCHCLHHCQLHLKCPSLQHC